MENYTTLGDVGTGEYEEKRSRFLGVAAPVKSGSEAAALVAKIKAEHYDARHHCYAYRLRDGTQRYADDGEPQGTAGLPILDVLERKGLVDCIIIVTRYFGGTLLGTGGLVRSYSAAANAALAAAPLLAMKQYTRCALVCDYNQYGRVEPLVMRQEGLVQDTRFEDKVSMDFYLPTPNLSPFAKELQELTAGQVTAEEKEQLFCGFANGQWFYE